MKICIKIISIMKNTTRTHGPSSSCSNTRTSFSSQRRHQSRSHRPCSAQECSVRSQMIHSQSWTTLSPPNLSQRSSLGSDEFSMSSLPRRLTLPPRQSWLMRLYLMKPNTPIKQSSPKRSQLFLRNHPKSLCQKFNNNLVS